MEEYVAEEYKTFNSYLNSILDNKVINVVTFMKRNNFLNILIQYREQLFTNKDNKN